MCFMYTCLHLYVYIYNMYMICIYVYDLPSMKLDVECMKQVNMNVRSCVLDV